MQRVVGRAVAAMVAIGAGSAGGGSVAQAETAHFAATDIPSVFFIGKSDDRNQVHYGIHLDKACHPVGTSPIFIYWKQIERGPNEVNDLNFLDRTVYGIRRQTLDVVTGTETGRVSFALEAAQKRAITFVARKDGDQCSVRAMTKLNTTAASLERIFVKLASLWRVEYLDLFGTEEATGKPIVERAHP
jgi:hypothetical protein